MKNFKILITAFVVGLGLLSFTTINKDKNEPQKEVKSAKGFIVVFTCNHCPYAKKYENRIIELDKKYKSQGYPVIAINPNDPSVQPEDGYKQMMKERKRKGLLSLI